MQRNPRQITVTEAAADGIGTYQCSVHKTFSRIIVFIYIAPLKTQVYKVRDHSRHVTNKCRKNHSFGATKAIQEPGNKLRPGWGQIKMRDTIN